MSPFTQSVIEAVSLRFPRVIISEVDTGFDFQFVQDWPFARPVVSDPGRYVEDARTYFWSLQKLGESSQEDLVRLLWVMRQDLHDELHDAVEAGLTKWEMKMPWSSPNAKANKRTYEVFGRLPSLTAHQAALLLLQRNPDELPEEVLYDLPVLTFQGEEVPMPKKFIDDFEDCRRIIEEHLCQGTLRNPITPSALVSFAQRQKIEVPPEFLAAVPLGATSQAANDNEGTGLTTQGKGNSTKSRTHPLDAVIAKAMSRAVDSSDPHSVWAALIEWAETDPPAPFLGATKNGELIYKAWDGNGNAVNTKYNKAAFVAKWRRAQLKGK